MRTVLFTIGLILTFMLNVSGQIHDHERFKELKENADLVVFGELVEKTSFWNPDQRMIFTSNWIKVFTTIKGSHSETIEIITNGGTVGDDTEWWSHETNLPEKSKGYFFLKVASTEIIKEGEFFRLNGQDAFISLRTKDTFGQVESLIVADTIVEFGFDNIQIDLPNLRFDVLIRSNINGLEFGKGELFLQYPEEVFGTDVVANDKIEASKGDVINSSEFSISLYDNEADIFQAVVDGGCVAPSTLTENGLPLSTEFQTFMRVSLEIQDFNALGSISMEELKMDGNIFHFDPLSNKCIPFNAIIFPNPIETGLVCSITSFMDTVVNAGTGDTLTIIGMNFEMPGQVEFANADNGGNPMFPAVAQPADIVTWNSDTIKVIVPSDPNPAGFGIFRVRTSSGMVCPSPAPLDVCYAVRNQRNATTGVAERWHLGSSVGDNKYTFRPDSILGNNAMAVATIEQALCDWNKASKINWELGAILNAASPLDDSLNHIFMASAAILPIGAAAQTLVRRKSCQTTSPPIFLIPYSGDIDMLIRADLTTLPVPVTGGWNFDHTAPPAANQYDFYTVALHELGHAHNLRHSMPLPKAMFWQSNAGDTLRDLHAKDILGANDILSTSTAALNQSFLCSPIDTISLCGTTSVIEIPTLGKVKVYPNPFTESINIELDLIQKENLSVQITDVTGKQILTQNIGNVYQGHQVFILKLPKNTPNGIYFLSLKYSGKVQSFKLIKF